MKYGMIPLEPVKHIGDAQFAYCHECGSWLGCQYWSLSKSVRLHTNSTGHKPTLYVATGYGLDLDNGSTRMARNVRAAFGARND